MQKVKTIKLSHGHGPADISFPRSEEEWQAAVRYRVEQVTDSVEFIPGQYLERSDVVILCGAPNWKVTIVPIKA